MLRDLVEGMGYELGLDDYPIFDEAYRARLNRAIYEHFMFRRIASSTPQKFIFFLNRYMRENMETYNALYRKIRDKDTDVFATHLAHDWGRDNSTNTGEGNSSSSSDAKSINSDTPQVYLENADDPKYMNNMNHALAGGSDSNRSKSDTASDYDRHSSSTDGGLSQAMYDIIASSIAATDNLVFAMLEPLFMTFADDQPR